MRYILVILFSVSLISCRFGFGERVSGNGRITTANHEPGNFNSVEASGEITVRIKQGTAGVKIETDENLMLYIEVFTTGEKLVIRGKEGYNLHPSKDIIAYVSAPLFKDIAVSGACDIIGEGLISGNQDLNMSVSGSGNIDMELDIPRVTTRVSGSGNVALRGQVSSFEASISGSGEIKCLDLATENARLRLSGSAEAEVNASKTLDVQVSGSGDVKYKGNAAVTKDISGAGSIKKIG